MKALFLAPLLWAMCSAFELLGMISDPSSNFAVIDINTGEADPGFGGPWPNIRGAVQLSAMDNAHQFFYTIANVDNNSTHLIGITTTTGGQGYLERDVVLPFEFEQLVGLGQGLAVEELSGDVFVFGAENKTAGGRSTHGAYAIDPVRGSLTYLNGITIADTQELVGAVSAYDTARATFWVVLTLNATGNVSGIVYGFNVRTRMVQHFPWYGTALSSLHYDPLSRVLIGLGEGLGTRSVVTIDPTSQRVTYVDVAGWNVSGPITFAPGAGPSNAGLLYALMQRAGASHEDVWYYVEIDVATGAARASGGTCPNVTRCPWTLEYARSS